MKDIIGTKIVYGKDLNEEQYSKLTYRSGINVADSKKPDQLGIIENPSFGIGKDFVAKYTVTVNAAENGEIEGVKDNDKLVYGSKVTITAKPSEGYHFDKWTIDSIEVEENPYTFIIKTNTEIAASFVVNE